MEEDDVIQLKENHNKLKKLAALVVVEYDTLYKKFKENEDAYNSVVKRLKDREDQLKQMKKLIEPAISEYERMKMKYEMELDCRSHAEIFASKLSSQNKELKRQSQMLLDLRGPNPPDITKINFDALEEVEQDTYADYTKDLNQKLQSLEEEVVELRQDLKTSKEDLAAEKDKSHKLAQKFNELRDNKLEMEKTLGQYKEAMKELSLVSEEALKEYTQLQQKYELEVQCRSGAEKYAAEIKIQNEAMKKQSTILLSEVTSNPPLMLALNEVETLTTELENEKLKHQEEIEKMKANQSEQTETETDQSKLQEEITQLEQKLQEYEQRYNALEEKYKEVETKLEVATRPPPPPPPPPPPSLTTKSKGFLSRIKEDDKKKANTLKNVTKNDAFSNAMSEMMERINSGKPLMAPKHTTRRKQTSESGLETVEEEPSESAEPSSGAMKELGSIMLKMKRSQSVSDVIDGNKENQPQQQQTPFFTFPKRRTPPKEPHTKVDDVFDDGKMFAATLPKLKGNRLQQLLNPVSEDEKK